MQSGSTEKPVKEMFRQPIVLRSVFKILFNSDKKTHHSTFKRCHNDGVLVTSGLVKRLVLTHRPVTYKLKPKQLASNMYWEGSRALDRYKHTSFRYKSKRNKKYYSHLKKKLDVDPQRDDDASPMSTYRCMLRPT